MTPCPECEGRGTMLIEDVEYGHACGGDEKLCQTKCPIPIQTQEIGPCTMCNGEGMVD